ncbi:MAG: nucleotide exchange factor GrpE [Desulfarculus sp.]|jgi:molecular chaperone GrpE|nr:MAG: nucleotide exchange factor GrpE [Desulfarculus sp.]
MIKHPHPQPDTHEQPPAEPPAAEQTPPPASAEQLASELAELKDRVLRQAAELENFKKRSEREKADFLRRANKGLVKDLLPVLDNLERALAHAKESADLASLLEGMELVHGELLKTLGRHGLEPVEALGQPFDPELHEAMMQEDNPELDENTVVGEMQKGYRFQDRLLRPAMVVVSKKPS